MAECRQGARANAAINCKETQEEAIGSLPSKKGVEHFALMATSKSGPLKDKSTSPSSSPSPSTGRRSPRPPGSPDRRLPTRTTTSDKPVHLKPKPTPSTTTTKSTKSSPSSATHSPPSTAGKRQPLARKPTEKPPSTSRKPIERTLSTPTTTREPSHKPASSSPVPRPHLSSRTSLLPLDKGAKSTARGARTGSFTRSKSLDKRKAAAVSSAVVHTSSASDSEASVIKKAELDAHVDKSPKAAEEVHKHEHAEHEHEQVESPGVTSNIAVKEATDSADDIIPEQLEETHSQTLVTENEDEAVVAHDEEEEEPKPEVIKEEAMQVDESPKEAAAAEPAQEAAVVAKPAGPRGATLGGEAKKEAQRSNDVIEEAKSKFLVKRKNKVLALVGAFETVMALQEPEGTQQSQHPKIDNEPEPEPEPVPEPEPEPEPEPKENSTITEEVSESTHEPTESKESTDPMESTDSTDPTEPLTEVIG